MPLRNDGNYRYPDDDVFLVVRGENARLMQFDMSIHGTPIPQTLINNDGTMVTEIVKSVRVPNPQAARWNRQFGKRHAATYSEVISERKRRARHGLFGRYRSLLDQQFAALPFADDHRADDDHGHGRELFHFAITRFTMSCPVPR